MIVKALISLCIVAATGTSSSQCRAQSTAEILTRVAAAQRFASEVGDTIWPGYGDAPFGVLLLEQDREVLACRSSPPSQFSPLGVDPATRCETFSRARSGMPETIEAAMPIFGPPSTIVVGTPASVGRGLGGWTHTLLHEHFHQWQSALPGYYAGVDALDLKNGDETGMWMLNFPFPYDAPDALAAHSAASLALAEAIAARGRPNFAERLTIYFERRAQFANAVGAQNWRYAELQLWQEGVARWSEIELGLRYPDPEVHASAQALQERTLAQLASPDLSASQRTFAYSFGAGEAMILEACNPTWRAEYPTVLALGPLLERCARQNAF